MMSEKLALQAAKVGTPTPMRQSVSSKSGFAFLALALFVAPSAAQDLPAYQDDRSSATALIQSLYNAIDRREYLRAWSYFGDNAWTGAENEQAAADYETFRQGYADTDFVTLLTGAQSSEGAAGSTYYTVPVAIDAVDRAGHHSQFAGCYVLRLAQPAIQDSPPFHPLHIEKGGLHPARGALETLLPQTCGQ